MNDDDIADITVCARTAYASCVEERKLKLRKCGNETQYNLKYTIPKSAYCFDPPGIGHLSDCLITQEETRLNGWMVAVIIVSILFVMAVIGVVVFECKNQMSKRQVSDSLYQDIIRPSDSVTNAGYMDMAETSLEN
ncbi:hypothetical protein MAR_014838 [Mya arenaria]|uniref:Uncharacterized protein n=1 Tax=Mya arenaria TaxID=6604 RepID=A0ABY7FHN0_MYAAR|nr:hypothetical protein MAR_014838 [Mya arenaria]